MDALYASTRVVTDPGDCFWYHAMDLPEIGTMQGAWDLRKTIDEYLGHYDFRGKRCLDIGAASGYLTFEMERRGAAEVVSVDLDPSAHAWKIVPFVGLDISHAIEEMAEYVRAWQRAYWLAHRLLGSKARVYYGTAYDLPAELGTFDVVLIGMMLPHVRDPFRVLEQAAARSSDTIIITQQASLDPEPLAHFMSDPATDLPNNAWWSMSEACVERMLAILGFELVSKTRAEHACPFRGDREFCTATIASKARHA